MYGLEPDINEYRSFISDKKAEVKQRYNDVCNDLNDVMSGKPITFNSIGWNGDASNQFGKDCIMQSIYDELAKIEDDAESLSIAL